MPTVRETDAAKTDLTTLLSERAAAASPSTLRVMLWVGVTGFAAALLFSGGRYYLAFPFLSAVCFALYGLAAHRVAVGNSDTDSDHARKVDARILMKASGILGIASGMAALLCFFLLVLGPSWNH